LLRETPGVEPPAERDPGHVYHLFVVRVRDRTPLQASLASRGVETLIHYPVPIPRQPAFAAFEPAECQAAARACDEVLSLPLHPRLTDAEVDAVAASIKRYTG
jgi:dTDP-4-amino-4,6-dideoxygalactose transaminase